MRNGKIYWIKQKALGVLLLIISLMLLKIVTEDFMAIIFLIMSVPACLWLLFEKKRLFEKDYIFNVRKFLE